MSAMIVFENIASKETVNQRCLLVTGRCEAANGDDSHIEVVVEDVRRRPTFPAQNWPMCQGIFKALVILAPGENLVRFTAGHDESCTAEISIQYVPLLQTPPLHLAILVARDSPLLIDCPPGKFGALSSAHSSLDAAVSKFRTTAYMWQALTAEEMRANGLGRRTFRLEEEWALDTLSSSYSRREAMQTTAKIHLVRTEKTVAELRDARLAQQNSSARNRDELHSLFSKALRAHGAPFTREAHPIVAGLVLDSHYDADAKLITAHAALGAHDPQGLSLGMFGSHLTYSWPRFVEEIPDCLLDTRAPGDRVGNDNGECASMWEACAVGQGAFLHEVGHAFSAPHTGGIMERGYSKDWPKCFLPKTATRRQTDEAGAVAVTGATPNQCRWDIRDLLRFRNLAHFQLPSDPDLDDTPPSVNIEDDDGADGALACITVGSEAGLAYVSLNGAVEPVPSIESPPKTIRYTLDELEGRFDREAPLQLEVFSGNGKQRSLDVWRVFRDRSVIRMPGTGIRLRKKCVSSSQSDKGDRPWTVLLEKPGQGDAMVRATKIDIRVGCVLDGAIVYYTDGTSAPCGRRGRESDHYGMGGHQARKLALPEGVDIAKVAVSMLNSGELAGLRIVLANGKAMGALNRRPGVPFEVMVPEEGHRIIGFCGTSGAFRTCKQFGIITAPADKELPQSVYQYLVQDSSTRKPRKTSGSDKDSTDEGSESGDSETEDSETETSEDNDSGYDHDSDVDIV